MNSKLIVPIIRDEKGNTVPGALVFTQISQNLGAFGSCDDQGMCNLEVPIELRNTQFTVAASGYKVYSLSIDLGEGDKQIRVGLEADPNRPQDIILAPLSFGKAPLWRPTLEQIKKFRGAFCVPNAFDISENIPYGDGKRIWTPALLAYDESLWQVIIDRYKKLHPNYTHFVINLGGSTYHNDYPHIDDNPSRARVALELLLSNRLIPICCATDDENPDVVLESYSQNADIIDCSMVMWEMNGPCEGDSDRMFAITQKVCKAAPLALPFLHFTAGHGSMGEPEGEWWKKCAAIGIAGLFSQDDHWDDVVNTAAGLEDTAAHLSGKRPGWEGLDLLNVAFEQTTTPVYHYDESQYASWSDPRKQLDFGDYIIQHCPNIAGYMDGTRL